MSRGIILTADETQRLVDSVQARDAITMLQNMAKPARTNDYERYEVTAIYYSKEEIEKACEMDPLTYLSVFTEFIIWIIIVILL